MARMFLDLFKRSPFGPLHNHMAKVRESMVAIAESLRSLSTQQGIPALAQLNDLNESLDKAIVKSEVKAKLAEENSTLETKKKSLEDALETTTDTGVPKISDLEKELDGL